MSNAVELVVMGARGRMGQMVLSACAKALREKPGSLKVLAGVEMQGTVAPGGSVTVDGVTWPYTKSICAPGLSGFRTQCAVNKVAIEHPEVFKGFDLRDSEGHYVDSIHRFLIENQGKLRR